MGCLFLFALCGCDGLFVPIPDDPPAQIRGILTGFVIPGGSGSVNFSRPYSVNEFSDAVWFDRYASTSQLTCRISSEREREWAVNAHGSSGTVELNIWPYDCVSDLRIEGRFKWNASAPFSSADEGYIQESFGIDLQKSDTTRFRHDAVRGSLELRWPKLARSNSESLSIWAEIPDSVRSFLKDWSETCARLGKPDDRLLMWDTARGSQAFRWKALDSVGLRTLMKSRNADWVAMSVFAPGDSIWVSPFRVEQIVIGYSTSGNGNTIYQVESAVPSASRAYYGLASWKYGKFLERSLRLSEFTAFVRASGPTTTSRYGLRVLISASGTCPAFEEWRRFGSTDRWHRPTGNVAPFDGYLCQMTPDTISFPRGDVVLVPPDSSIQPKVVVKVDSLKPFPAISTP